ncbi:DUF4097 family beta strand repeat-containing protein [Streptomyces sp. NPDC057638]|uniref:DUF4097 family beta strand repeat-containing protein n=1 Tax=Streptomyces sp. NPDC057638 TaxID=3346190 RepID=UPI0036A2EC8F
MSPNSLSRFRTSRRARTGAALLGGGVLMGVVAGCGGTDLDSAPVERKTFALKGEVLTVDSDNSVLKIVPADVKDVEVARQVDGWVFLGGGPDASWRMTDDGKLKLRFDCDALASDCQARHTIKVPRGVEVKVRNDNGQVTASGFTAPLEIKTENGDVSVRNTTGPLTLRSDNGDVVAKAITAPTLTAHSTNSSVRIEVKADAAAGAVPERVEASSDNGGVTVRLPRAGAPYAVKASSGNGRVDVDVPVDKDSARVVSARSDNGHVRVRGAE